MHEHAKVDFSSSPKFIIGHSALYFLDFSCLNQSGFQLPRQYMIPKTYFSIVFLDFSCQAKVDFSCQSSLQFMKYILYCILCISIVWISSSLHWWTASWRVVSVACNSWISKSLPFQNGISSEKANSEQKLTRGNCFSIFCNALANFTNNYMVSLFENITFHLQCSILKAELFNEAGKLLV